MFDTPQTPATPNPAGLQDTSSDRHVPIDRRIADRPKTGEAPFAVDDVFYSRTDKRGIVLAGNYCFQRISHFDWSELIGAPHNLVRHPDMPKGVFWLFWNTLKSGKPVGAYVKNKTKDGLYYWVFACAIPIEDGYMSARIKPTSDMLAKIQDEYAALLAQEKSEGLSPEESAKRLLNQICDLGFDDYHQFETAALGQELQSRNLAMKQKSDDRILIYKSMLALSQNLKSATETLVREFESVQIIPNNMRVMASRLEPTGGPLTTLSTNYGAMSTEISDWFESNVVGEHSIFATIADNVNGSMFNEALVGILRQCDDQLNGERRQLGDIDIDAEHAVLRKIVQDYSAISHANAELIINEAGRIQYACKTMARHVLGLSTTRVMCKIESARMGLSGEGLSDIIVQLGRFQEKIGDQLDAIAKMGEDIQSAAKKMVGDPHA